MKTSIVVCGSGIVGMATALAFARRGQQVALLGPRQTSTAANPEHYQPRVYAISPSSQKFLTALGVWDMLPKARLTRVQAMEVFGDAQGHLNLRAWQNALPELAWIIEASEIERALVQAVQIFGLTWVTEQFTSYAPGVITTDGGTSMQAELFVAADGAQSRLRAAAGLPVDVHSYGATALVAHLNAERAHLGTALQWFSAQGVLALLPMPDTSEGPQVSMVWSLKSELAQVLLDLPEHARSQALSSRLAQATSGRLGQLSLRSPVHSFPLTLNQSPMIGQGLALAGDAAHRLHPLAGQGLNLGLGDVQALVDVVAGREPFRSPGDPMVLRRYRRARAEPVLAMRFATDGMHRLFDIQSAPVAWLRNVGMNLVEKLPFIKRQLINSASR